MTKKVWLNIVRMLKNEHVSCLQDTTNFLAIRLAAASFGCTYHSFKLLHLWGWIWGLVFSFQEKCNLNC